MHSDLRPGNLLVHDTSSSPRGGGADCTRRGDEIDDANGGSRPALSGLDLLLCDFGGSYCGALDLDGGSLPCEPFYHPAFDGDEDECSPALDMFSLGSVMYVVLTGR